MWHFLWKDERVDDVPITHVTNGVHTANWMARRLRILLDMYFGDDWYEQLDEPNLWKKLDTFQMKTCGQCASISNANWPYLVNLCRDRWTDGGFHPVQVVSSGVLINPYALTIGFRASLCNL